MPAVNIGATAATWRIIIIIATAAIEFGRKITRVRPKFEG